MEPHRPSAGRRGVEAATTGPQPKVVASSGVGDRCPYRSVCAPSAKAGGGKVLVEGCVTLLGPPKPLNRELVEILGADVAQGRAFVIAAGCEDTLRMVLSVVDQLALLAAAPVGRA
jgi:hypothetical protein